ncbi:MAG: hypothetical protein JRN67_01630 [Nitrososphaerota archaeon]|nr:hypothetical protein [Nitrososphaerota archaeon]MDG7000109.1 hypothetical protein [Nitrososphaerota archaeon]
MSLRVLPVIVVLLVIALALVSGLYLVQGQKVVTKTLVSTSLVTLTSTQTVILTGGPKALQTITEQIIVMYAGTYTVYVFGNCTSGGGTIEINPTSSTTEYIFSSNATGILNVTITTVENQFVSTSTVTVHSSLQPQTITVVNGTVTSYSTQTCPAFT